jgi:hypothetical protein
MAAWAPGLAQLVHCPRTAVRGYDLETKGGGFMNINRSLTTALFLLVAAAPALAQTSGAGQLKAGAAKVDVTQWSALPIAAEKYEHQRAHVRAIVVDNGATRAALISIPGSRFDWPAISQQVAAELNIPATQMVVSSTHSHSYQSTRSRIEVSLDPTTKAVVAAVRQAKANLQPARMGFGIGNSYLNVNRDAIDRDTRKWSQYSNLDGPSDKTVSVLTFAKPTGEPIAVYVSYAMHPVNAYALDITTGDFPEAMSRYVEKAFGDQAIVTFGLGAAGDQNPLYLRPSTNVMATRSGPKITGFEMNREASEGPLRVTDASGKAVLNKAADPKVMDELLRFIESEGQILGEEVIRVMTFTKTTDQARIAGYQKTPMCPARKRTNGDKMDPTSREGMAAVYVDQPPLGIPVGVLTLGPVAIAAVGEEPYSMIGVKAKQEAPLANTFVVSLANERARTGYIPDDASYGHETFQVLNSALKPGCAERAIIDTINELETQYLNAR